MIKIITNNLKTTISSSIKITNNSSKSSIIESSLYYTTTSTTDKDKKYQIKREKKRISKFQYNIPNNTTIIANKKNNENIEKEKQQNIIFSALSKKPISTNTTITPQIQITNNNNNNVNNNNSNNNNINPNSNKLFINLVNSMDEKKIEKFENELKEDAAKVFSNKQNHIIYFKYLSSKIRNIGFKDLSTWYKLKRIDFIKYHGRLLIDQYGGDHIQTIMSNFPDFNWQIWKFSTVNKTFWLNDENILQYLQWLVKQTNRDISDLEQCHYISESDFIRNHGQFLISQYKFVCNIFLKYFPNYNWKPWLFEKYPKDYFKNKNNIKKYLLWLGNDILGYKSMEDYYKLKLSDFKNNGGFFIISKNYKKSCYKLVVDILKEEEGEGSFKWEAWRFRIIPMKRINVEILNQYHNHLKQLLNCKNDNDLIQYFENKSIDQQIEIIKNSNGIDIINEFGGTIKSSFERINNYLDFELEALEDDDDEGGDGVGVGLGDDDDMIDFDDNFEIDQKEEHIKEFEKDTNTNTTTSNKSDKLIFKKKK